MGYVDSLIANAMLYVRLCIWKEALSHQSANFEKLDFSFQRYCCVQ